MLHYTHTHTHTLPITLQPGEVVLLIFRQETLRCSHTDQVFTGSQPPPPPPLHTHTIYTVFFLYINTHLHLLPAWTATLHYAPHRALQSSENDHSWIMEKSKYVLSLMFPERLTGTKITRATLGWNENSWYFIEWNWIRNKYIYTTTEEC